MPCTDGGVPYGLTDEQSHAAAAMPELCKLMKILEKKGKITYQETPESVLEWWVEHKRRDVRRERIEKESQKYFKKRAQERIARLRKEYDLK